MKRVLLFLIVPALVAGFVLTSDTTSSKGPPPRALPQCLALGDSIAVGVGASDPATTGYVPLLCDFLETEAGLGTELTLNNLGVGGAKIGDLLEKKGQLSQAVKELKQRNGDKKPSNDVEVITLTIGGNDVFALVGTPADPGPCFGGPTSECFAAIASTFATFSANFDFILDELRSAAGPDTPIIVMTYYNPLPTCFLALLAPLADIVLEGGGPLTDGLNDLIRSIADRPKVEVADTFGKLGSGDFVGGADCLHPVDSGYEKIADLFIGSFD